MANRMTRAQILALCKTTGQQVDLAPPRQKAYEDHPDGTPLERAFITEWYRLKDDGLPDPVREYRFDENRKWRFDFAWPEQKVACECEGRGHQKENRYTGDLEKYNKAALSWTVLRCTSAMLRDDPEGFIHLVVQAMMIPK
jgi:very-short-patch-repair endonuclease